MELYIVYEIIGLIVCERQWQAKHPQWLCQLRLKWPLCITMIPPGFTPVYLMTDSQAMNVGHPHRCLPIAEGSGFSLGKTHQDARRLETNLKFNNPV